MMKRTLEKSNVRPKKIQELKAQLKGYASPTEREYLEPFDKQTKKAQIVYLAKYNSKPEDEITTDEMTIVVDGYSIKPLKGSWKAELEAKLRFHNNTSQIRTGQRLVKANIIRAVKVDHPEFDHRVWVVRIINSPEDYKQLVHTQERIFEADKKRLDDYKLTQKTPQKIREKNSNEFLEGLLRKEKNEDV
jgi:hypothetical protein